MDPLEWLARLADHIGGPGPTSHPLLRPLRQSRPRGAAGRGGAAPRGRGGAADEAPLLAHLGPAHCQGVSGGSARLPPLWRAAQRWWPTSPTRWRSGRSWTISTSLRPRSRLPTSPTSSACRWTKRAERSRSSPPELLSATPPHPTRGVVSAAREVTAITPASRAQEDGPELRRTPSHAGRRGWRRPNPSQAAPATVCRRFTGLSVRLSSPSPVAPALSVGLVVRASWVTWRRLRWVGTRTRITCTRNPSTEASNPSLSATSAFPGLGSTVLKRPLQPAATYWVSPQPLGQCLSRPGH
jgi:hypothetical protein